MLSKGQQRTSTDVTTPEEEIKDPFFSEFMDLKDEYSESDLEFALISKLETFLLELGGDFTFVGRQRRLRVADAWHKIDLLFFHRRHLYLNFAREHWMVEGENPVAAHADACTST